MLVRLLDADRACLDTVQAPLARFPLRTFRHDGMLYERVSDGPDGMPQYRATERIPQRVPRTVTVISAAGAEIGAVTFVGTLPAFVQFDGVRCPLWTVKDQAGRALYLKPEAA